MKPWITWVLFIIALIYNLLDVYNTKLLLSVGAKEFNPIMGYFINTYGVNSLYGVKLIVFIWLGIFLIIHQIQFKRKRDAEINVRFIRN